VGNNALVSSLFEGLNPEDVRGRLEAFRRARRQDEDGEFLEGTFRLCGQACDRLDDARTALDDARTALAGVGKVPVRAAGDFDVEELLKALSAASSRLSSIVRGLRKLEDRSKQLKEDEGERMRESEELLRLAHARMAEALGAIGDARKLAERTDRRARSGPGSRVILSRRLQSREFLKVVSGIRDGLSRVTRRVRVAAGLQEESVRNSVNLDPGFE